VEQANRLALPDLASRLFGGGVVAANDEFFAAADNLVTPEPPTFQARTFAAKGQVYDGWETRRRRDRGVVPDPFDEAVVRLGAPGVVRAVVVDTAFFTGNYPPFASVEGCGVEGYPTPAELADAAWEPLVPRSALRGDAANVFDVDLPRRVTHVRLRIYPDGGVARLRVHGEVVPDPRFLVGGPPGAGFDLAAMEHGASVVDCSDMFYGAPMNLIAPGLARSMGEGWETRRRRDDGNDYVVVRLAAPGTVAVAELDTSHFKGNAPAAATLRGAHRTDGALPDPTQWSDLLPRVALRPDTRHRFLVPTGEPVTHVRVDIDPDGGMARLRLYGRITDEGMAELGRRWWSLLPAAQAAQVRAQPRTEPLPGVPVG
jgi:allantoicase